MLKITCLECNVVFYEGEEWQPLETVLQNLNYQCPKCKRKIDNPTPNKILVNNKTLKFGKETKPTTEPKQDKKWWRK